MVEFQAGQVRHVAELAAVLLQTLVPDFEEKPAFGGLRGLAVVGVHLQFYNTFRSLELVVLFEPNLGVLPDLQQLHSLGLGFILGQHIEVSGQQSVQRRQVKFLTVVLYGWVLEFLNQGSGVLLAAVIVFIPLLIQGHLAVLEAL